MRRFLWEYFIAHILGLLIPLIHNADKCNFLKLLSGSADPACRIDIADANLDKKYIECPVDILPFIVIILVLFAMAYFAVWNVFEFFEDPVLENIKEKMKKKNKVYLKLNQRQCIKEALKLEPRAARVMPKKGLMRQILERAMGRRFKNAFFSFAVLQICTLVISQFMSADHPIQYWIDLFQCMVTSLFLNEAWMEMYTIGWTNYWSKAINKMNLIAIVIPLINWNFTIFGSNLISANWIIVFRLIRILQFFSSFRSLLWALQDTIEVLPYIWPGTVVISIQFVCLQFLSQITRKTFQCETYDGNMVRFYQAATTSNIQNIMLASYLLIQFLTALYFKRFYPVSRDLPFLRPYHLEEFVKAWEIFDPQATGKVKHTNLIRMMRKIPRPVGFGLCYPHRLACRGMMVMNIPVDSDGNVCFTKTLLAVVRQNLRIYTGKNIQNANKALEIAVKHDYPLKFDTMLSNMIPKVGEPTIREYYAACVIQSYFRQMKKRQLAKAAEIADESTKCEEMGGDDESIFTLCSIPDEQKAADVDIDIKSDSGSDIETENDNDNDSEIVIDIDIEKQQDGDSCSQKSSSLKSWTEVEIVTVSCEDEEKVPLNNVASTSI